MKLNIFNTWKKLGALAGKTLEYQSTQIKGASSYVTHIRDAASEKLITKGYGMDKEKSQKAAYDNLKKIGVEGLLNAIESGEIQMPTQIAPKDEKEIQWRDGVGHSYKAQKRIVGERLMIEPDESLAESFKQFLMEKDSDMTPVIRNPVAKHAHKYNKAAVHKDKKKESKRTWDKKETE